MIEEDLRMDVDRKGVNLRESSLIDIDVLFR